ncbi:uncharacterized protein LOC124690621 [Lolium rigidum]|uniref:uncharacterized protein LOC124690621 n=1 Tax=Lolium rigidum TaxID=89674 RepID=UPI001F5D64A7|nr:uncharacterized protein LOC124690621 [Lolium rigidum]
MLDTPEKSLDVAASHIRLCSNIGYALSDKTGSWKIQWLEDGDSDDLHRPVCVFLSGGRAITVLQMSAMVKKIPLDQHIGNLLERRTSCFMSMLFYVADVCSHDGNQLICRKFTILRTGTFKTDVCEQEIAGNIALEFRDYHVDKQLDL